MPAIAYGEAISVSEVLHLCEHQPIDVIVVSGEIATDVLLPLQLKQPTISLHSDCSTREVVWQLQELFPFKPEQIH